MSEKPEDPKEPKDLKDLMPTERKTVWRTAAERKMSDLARELEWLERRKGKKKQPVQKQKVVVMEPPKAKMKEGKKVKGIKKQQERSTKMKLQEQTAGPGSRGRTGSTTLYQRPFGGEQRRLSIFTGTHDKDGARRSDFFPGYISQQEILNFKNWIRVRQARHLRHKIKGGTQTRVLALYLHEPEELDIKDAVTLESTPRSNTFRRQSLYADPSIQDNAFGNRRMTMMKDWLARTSDIAFERKLKSLMEKGTEPKIENVKMLKPEEVLSCRYLRLSENNIRTLVKLCKDVGLNMDIHPHMTETEIDVQKVFPPKCSSTTP